ncbi:MAG TPA: bifunctional DNA-formamidopyrimidine glycosylase/DNA-(apurinic or apyrimidinic site) lyase [bacterium]|nr:bifunctional DNA-formamidopyrimidine glycosylase/DNA-(apurinic or apyrimidinic site) lyase [bacterium]HQJ64355.1 bifunctional DNA-formamidopyrimidine glycosylase/DNA-(apurinic or apyrimidinic site) lyase [bacterium]HQJ65467.1 bifunctional DNA-formamidopyrimidine glycosylase/DNA-(apurinic or apyrimidinic site) lyase [bacterium]
MPELPEVETICRSLAPHITGKLLAGVEVSAPKLRRPLPSATVLRGLSNQRILALERRAKYLLWHLDGGGVLVIHLGMSGRLSYCNPPRPAEPHTHVIFHFTDGGELHFRDPRRFGSLDYAGPGEALEMAFLRDLGLEPLSPAFTPDFLRQRLASTQRTVKTLIMDQRVVVGVGNIYANEALFRAGLHPQRRGNSLSAQEGAALHAAVVQVLQEAVERGGTTLTDFRNAEGEPGFFQLDLAVYGRQQQPCPRCGREILRLVQGGRSSFFCETCQK